MTIEVRSTSLSKESERAAFVEKAAAHFAANKANWSFGNIMRGEYLALRWGMGDDCVLVIKQDENEIAVNYGQAIQKESE
jgi:hypothetical protein